MGAGTIIVGIAIIAGVVVLLRYGLQQYDLWTMERAEQRRRRAEDQGGRA